MDEAGGTAAVRPSAFTHYLRCTTLVPCMVLSCQSRLFPHIASGCFWFLQRDSGGDGCAAMVPEMAAAEVSRE